MKVGYTLCVLGLGLSFLTIPLANRPEAGLVALLSLIALIAGGLSLSAASRQKKKKSLDVAEE